MGDIENGYWDMFIIDVINISNEELNCSNLLVGNGEVFFSNDVGVIGIGVMCWDGVNDFEEIDVDGLGGINIEENGLNSIVMGLLSDFFGLNVRFNIYDVFGKMLYIDWIFFFFILMKVNEDFFFSDFVGNVDFIDVGVIELLFKGL